MKTLNLKNIRKEEFESAFNSAKKFVSSDFVFDNETQALTTPSEEFDKWHLVTLGTSYGANVFRSKMRLRILQYQDCNIRFEKRYGASKVQITTDWRDEIEIPIHVLFSADSYMLNKFYNYLNDKSKEFLHKKMPKLDAKQSVYLNGTDYYKYAFNIFKSTLVLINVNGESALISDLWKVEWYEI
ncbi:hypothetical protein [Chondrinema litorale]|uniref:hypothetical protein n=1 Tax=Chondrinema litorale TaxID=2994555 RepID=UPI002543C690|nr:hypothetical protein [Chondrinema litorale]UZR96793.1 hypothetical protein OQ292_24140 [Chondrinema litorale]